MATVTRWRALLFLRGTSPSEIEAMDYFSLRYWADLAESALEAQQKARPK